MLEERSHVSVVAALRFHKCRVSGLLSGAHLLLDFRGAVWVSHSVTHRKSQMARDWLSPTAVTPSPAAAARGIQGTEMLLCGYFSNPLLYYCSC